MFFQPIALLVLTCAFLSAAAPLKIERDTLIPVPMANAGRNVERDALVSPYNEKRADARTALPQGRDPNHLLAAPF